MVLEIVLILLQLLYLSKTRQMFVCHEGCHVSHKRVVRVEYGFDSSDVLRSRVIRRLVKQFLRVCVSLWYTVIFSRSLFRLRKVIYIYP